MHLNLAPQCIGSSVPMGTGKPVEDGTEQRGHGYGTCERDSVERFPWFHGTCSVYSATRENFVFHGTYPSRFPRKNAVPRNKIGVFPPFLQLLTFSNFNFGNKQKNTPPNLVHLLFWCILPWKKRDLSTDEKILTQHWVSFWTNKFHQERRLLLHFI